MVEESASKDLEGFPKAHPELPVFPIMGILKDGLAEVKTDFRENL